MQNIETSNADISKDDASVASDAESEISPVDVTPTPASRKRKGIFMDAVKVPSVEQVCTRRRHSWDPAGLAPGADVESVPEPATEAPKQTIRRTDRKSTRLNSSHSGESRMPSSA